MNRTHPFLISLLLLYGGALLAGVLIPEIDSSSEAREVHVSETIQKSGNWLVPHRGPLIASKPPLAHWLVTSSTTLFSFEFLSAHRLLSVFSGLAFLWVTYGLTSFFAGGVGGVAKFAPLLSVLIVMTSYQFARLVVDARVDMLFSVLSVASIYFLLLVSRSQDSFSQKALWYAWAVFVAAAVLTKGPLGAVMSVLIGVVVLLLFQGFGASREMIRAVPIGAVALAISPALWYFYAFQIAGTPFIERHVFENFVRLHGESTYIPSRGSWYYLGSWLRNAFPWALLFLAQLCWLLFSRGVKDKRSRPLVILSAWVVLGTMLLSFAAGKRHSYLLPFFPAMASAVSLFLVIRWSQVSGRWKLRALCWLERSRAFLMLLLVLFVVGLELAGSGSFGQSILFQAAVAWLLEFRVPIQTILIGGILLLWSTGSGQATEKRIVVQGVVFSALLLMTVSIGRGIKAEMKGFRFFASHIEKVVPEGETLYVARSLYDELMDPVLYYLDREYQLILDSKAPLICSGFVLSRKGARSSSFSSVGLDLAQFRYLHDRVRGRSYRTIVLQQLNGCARISLERFDREI